MTTHTQDSQHATAAKVSVAMCTYNGARFLQEQLESIAKQSLLPSEVVICDDRSSDGTVSLLEAFAQTAPFPVRVYVNAEQLYTTRNFEKAMRLCTGEFIALSDQDDVWDGRKLETLVRLLQANPKAEGAFSDAILIDDTSKPTGRRLWEDFRFGTAKQKKFLSDPVSLLLKHEIVTGATLLIRMSLLRSYDTIPAGWLHDAWLTWMIALHGQFQLTSVPLTRYRLHAAQQVGTGKSVRHDFGKDKTALQLGRYLDVAARFNGLLLYIQKSCPTDTSLAHAVGAKGNFLRKRSKLPKPLLLRLLFIVRNISEYRHYARSIRSVGKDLLL